MLQAGGGIRDANELRGLGDVNKRRKLICDSRDERKEAAGVTSTGDM